MIHVELYPHQIEAIEKISNGKILCGGVGSGKSLTVIAYYMQNHAPKDIYVITTAKKRDSLDWEAEAVKYGIGTKPGETLAGVLTVDSWNNIGKYTSVSDAYFVFDEQRVVGSGAWTKAFTKIARQNSWNLLSATPGDTWMDYIPVFVANNLYKNRTEFCREHVVYAPYAKFPKVMRYTGVDTLERWRNLLLVEMPDERHTVRILEEVEVEHDAEAIREAIKTRWNPFEDEPMKDISELFRVMRKIAGTDPSRLNAIRKLAKKHKKLIVFYNFNYELDILRTLAKDHLVAEWNGHKKEAIPEENEWVYLVQYVAGAEGWNCIETDAMAFYSLTYSYKNLEQAMGRIDRINTPFTDLYYYLLMSSAAIDKGVYSSLEDKKQFNELDWYDNQKGEL